MAEQLDISPPSISYMQSEEVVKCSDQCEVGIDANLHKTLFKRCNQSEVNALAGKNVQMSKHDGA